jgi:DNA-directed RNA polymerase subunit RPC12/RpoP
MKVKSMNCLKCGHEVDMGTSTWYTCPACGFAVKPECKIKGWRENLWIHKGYWFEIPDGCLFVANWEKA